MVVGPAFSVDGVTYTPSDVMNYDAVGYAGAAPNGGMSVSAAHRTLPLPSYVEVTALDTGRTILVRVERRGPMLGGDLIELSPGAALQLGRNAQQRGAVRVRRVNPQEYERALLRTNQRAPERLVTPGPLLEVLRKLLAAKSAPASLAVVDPDPVAGDPVAAAPPVKPVPVKAIPAKPTAAKPATSKPTPTKAPPANVATVSVTGGFTVQIAAFASRANADATAKKLGGRVSGSVKLWRVQLGPFANRAAAETGLARAKKAGFGDARIVSPGK